MKLSLVVLILIGTSLAVHSQQGTPTLTSTDTPNGKRGDVVSISGQNLQKELVAKVLLTDGKNDFPVTVTEQTATTIKFTIPDKVPPGRLALMVLTTGKGGPQQYIFLPRLKLTVDQRGDFQVDDTEEPPKPSPSGLVFADQGGNSHAEDTYKRKATDRAQAVKWIQEQNDIVMGKGERTLALIESVTTWYKIDSTHPKAVAESEQLREFYASFGEEYHGLLLMYDANERVLRSEDIMLLHEATNASQEITSKMRRLKAMGFQ